MPDQWDVQPTIKRVVASLQKRRYQIWFDIESMKGSVIDAMSDAIDNSEAMLYAVSEKYKESGSVLSTQLDSQLPYLRAILLL